MFLRGFFDSEGSVSESGAITATNTNYELLDYIKDLLWRRFNIVAMGPKPLGLQGKIFYCRKRRKTLQV
jgi:intein-encoded DNA endonuclease-like protein